MHSVLSDVARDWLPASRVYGRQTNTVLLLASRDNVNFGAKNINICLNFASRGDQFGKLTRELRQESCRVWQDWGGKRNLLGKYWTRWREKGQGSFALVRRNDVWPGS